MQCKIELHKGPHKLILAGDTHAFIGALAIGQNGIDADAELQGYSLGGEAAGNLRTDLCFAGRQAWDFGAQKMLKIGGVSASCHGQIIGVSLRQGKQDLGRFK